MEQIPHFTLIFNRNLQQIDERDAALKKKFFRSQIGTILSQHEFFFSKCSEMNACSCSITADSNVIAAETQRMFSCVYLYILLTWIKVNVIFRPVLLKPTSMRITSVNSNKI